MFYQYISDEKYTGTFLLVVGRPTNFNCYVNNEIGQRNGHIRSRYTAGTSQVGSYRIWNSRTDKIEISTTSYGVSGAANHVAWTPTLADINRHRNSKWWPSSGIQVLYILRPETRKHKIYAVFSYALILWTHCQHLLISTDIGRIW